MDQIDERQIEVLRVGFVIEPRIDPVARQQRIAEPHIPPLRQIDCLVELRQGDDAAADQKIAERAIGRRQRHGLSRTQLARPAAEHALQRQQQCRGRQQPESGDDPGAEALGDRQPRHLVRIGNLDHGVALGRHRERHAVVVDEGDVAVIEMKLGRRRQRAIGRQRLDPKAGIVAGGDDLRDRAADKAAEIEQRASGAIDHRHAAAIEAHARRAVRRAAVR